MCMMVLLMLLTACGANSQASQATPSPMPTATATPPPTPYPTDTPTPIPSLPPVGEWLDSTTYGNVAFVLDIQKVNSTTNVASMTTVSYACVTDYSIDGYPSKVKLYTDTESASDSINGSDISVSVSIHYRSWATGNIVSNYMQFAGTINHDQSISMASSSLNGLQDYAFTQTTGAVAQMQHTYSQEKCASS